MPEGEDNTFPAVREGSIEVEEEVQGCQADFAFRNAGINPPKQNGFRVSLKGLPPTGIGFQERILPPFPRNAGWRFPDPSHAAGDPPR